MLCDLKMKVSVAMITYNHEEFIAKALDSVLMQETNFDYEIVVGEDCSTDNTRNILIGYQERYPDKFRLFLNEKNLGAHRNFVQVHQACQGKYIALLEGDDYWTSPQKLQKQADFLDIHPECAICFHNARIIHTPPNVLPLISGNRDYCSPNQKEFSTVEDLLEKDFIPTCSTMFRRGLFGDFPDWIYPLKMGDWPLHILNALHGNIGYINEVMGVYVINSGGVWTRMRLNWEEHDKAMIEFYDALSIHLEFKYKKIIDRKLSNLCLHLAEKYEDKGDLEKAKAFTTRGFTKHFLISRRLIKILLRLYIPILYKLLRSLKRTTYLIMGKKQPRYIEG